MVMEEKLIGDVTHYNRVRGFGFLAGSDGQSHFFNIKDVQIENGVKLIPAIGDLFIFSVRPSTHKPGYFEAFNISLTKRATPATLPVPTIPAESAKGSL